MGPWIALASLLSALGPASPAPLDSTAVQAILHRADQSRGNLDGVVWTVKVEAIEPGRTRTVTYEVKARGYDILAETISPPKHKGDKLLLVDRNMWFYKPDLSKPVSISRRQRLLGSASYGDIAATNYADDYAAVRLPDKPIDGEECYVFDLTARDTKSTYDRIKYWISQDRGVGVKAEYYTVSGKKLKTGVMKYENTVQIEGRSTPFISQLVIYNDLSQEDRTVMSFSPPKFETLDDYVFSLSFLTQ